MSPPCTKAFILEPNRPGLEDDFQEFRCQCKFLQYDMQIIGAYNSIMLRLMCVTAHPDDEAGSFGGTLRLYHDRGVETCVVCLTPGQAATHRGSAKNDQELAAVRRREFAASCEILKVNRGVVLDYPDGQLHRTELHKVVTDLTLHLRQFRPQVVITFGPEGGLTGHTDHSMASVFATLAFHWAGRNNRCADQLSDTIKPHQTQKLYFATANFTLPGRQPIALSPASAVIEIDKYFETKVTAFKTHITQAPLWPLFESHVRGRGTQEMFHLAAVSEIASATQETDLFDGVRSTS